MRFLAVRSGAEGTRKIVKRHNVGAHPRRLRRASDADGVGCSAVLERCRGRTGLAVLAYHIQKGRTYASTSLQPHSFQSSSPPRIGQVSAMHVPVVGDVLQAKAVGAERIFEALGALRTHLVEIVFGK